MFVICNCCLFVESLTKGYSMRLFCDLLITCFSLSNSPDNDKSYNRRFPNREGNLNTKKDLKMKQKIGKQTVN